MLSIQVVTDVSIEPVSLADAKAFMLVDASFTADDSLITSMIKAARQQLEDYTNLSFAEKTLRVFTDKPWLMLPFSPVIEVTEVTNQDGDSVESDDYKLIAGQKIEIGSCHGYEYGASYNITYKAGYNEDNPIPEALKVAIKEQANHLYNSRGMGENKLSFVACSLCDPYSRRVWL